MSAWEIRNNKIWEVTSEGEVKDGTPQTFEELWKEKHAILIFFRRFGWPFCRLVAKKMTDLATRLQQDRSDVQIIGIGLEKEGVKDFVDGQFFGNNPLYIDGEV